MHINQIYLLVHPGFCEQQTPHWPLTERQKQLKDSWNELANDIGKQTDSILIYISNRYLKFQAAFLDDTSPVGAYESQRIKDYKKILDTRLILLHDYSPIHELRLDIKNILPQTLNARGFSFNPSEVTLFTFGEVFGLCEETRSRLVMTALNIPDSQRVRLEDMSLTNEEAEMHYRMGIKYGVRPKRER